MTEPVYKFNGWYAGNPATTSDGTYSRWSDFIIVSWNELSNTGMIQQEDSVGNMPLLYDITRDSMGPNYYNLRTGPTKFQRIRVLNDTTICMNPEDVQAYWRVFTSVPEPPVPDYNQIDPSAPDFIRNKPVIAKADWATTDSTAPSFIANKPPVVKPDWATTDSSASSYIANKPAFSTGGAAQIQGDWLQTNLAAVDYIKNKPAISATGTVVQKQGDWLQTNTTALDYIKNKPATVPVTQANWTMSDTTSPAFIMNKPAVAAAIQPNWAVSDTASPAFILNKPALQATNQVLVSGSMKNVWSIPANRTVSYAYKGIPVGKAVGIFFSVEMDIGVESLYSGDSGRPIPCVGKVDFTLQTMSLGIVLNHVGYWDKGPDFNWIDGLTFRYVIVPMT